MVGASEAHYPTSAFERPDSCHLASTFLSYMGQYILVNGMGTVIRYDNDVLLVCDICASEAGNMFNNDNPHEP